MKRIAALVACFVFILVSAAHAEAPKARVESGALAGAVEGGVHVFRNIPFAAPPVGQLRWRPPEAAPSWAGEREAVSYGPACPQPARNDGAGGGRADRQSEDCLQLNVWSPPGANKLPVLVWIHGGGHRIGSGAFPIYDGSALAQQGLIVVTINYRLGPLGYFAHPALTAEAEAHAPLGNYGFLDQIAALKWVQRNIAAFGGDPTRVTVFGESAGGASLIFLMASPSAKGLFHRAIIQSGGGLQRPDDLATQERKGTATAMAAGVPGEASAAALRALPAEKWIEAQGPLQGAGFGPFIDGRAITEAPWRAFADGRAAAVPLLIGWNDNEASVLTTLGVPMEAAKALAGARAADFRALYGGVSDEEFARRALGDAFFGAPAAWMAAEQAKRAPTYLYHFTYVLEKRRAYAQGANHGSEIPYVFQTWDRIGPIASAMAGDPDRRFARMISSCWGSFAKTGTPHCDNGPEWPAYERQTDILMVFAPRTRPEPVPGRRQFDLLTDWFFRSPS